MASNAEQLQQHVKSNPGVYRAAIAKGVITEQDLKIAGNAGGNYSYEDQDAALQRINDAFGEYAKKNPEHEQFKKFVSGIPTVQKFEPKAEDWQKYDNNQMGRLAESMKFNWANPADRSQMMSQLMNSQISSDKKKAFNDFNKENPKTSWLLKNVIAPNAMNRMAQGEDITNTDIGLDVANNAINLVPGGTSLGRMAAVFGTEAANTLAQDINQGNELGLHNVLQPLLALGAGISPDAGKWVIDRAKDILPKGGTVGKVVNSIGQKAEKLLSTEADDATRAVSEAAEAAKRSSKVRQGKAGTTRYEQYRQETLKRGETPLSKAELEADKLARQRKEILGSKDPKAKWESLSNSEREKLMTPEFSKAYQAKINPKANRAATAAQGGVKSISRASVRTEGQKQNAQDKKVNIEKIFASPELADWIRLKKRGYNPSIPAEYREYEDRLNQMIHDPKRNLL